MGTCEVCGNEYDMAFEVVAAGATHVFDSFECAIHKMAPICEHCGCRIIGHGVEAEGISFAAPTARGWSGSRHSEPRALFVDSSRESVMLSS